MKKSDSRTSRIFLLYRKQRFRKAKKIICPAERPLRVLGDGQFENGRRVTAKPFSFFTGNCVSVKNQKILHQKFHKHANLMNYRKFTQNERRDLIFITVFITDPPFFYHGFITEKTLQSPI